LLAVLMFAICGAINHKKIPVGITSGYAIIPGGYAHKSCVHQIPNGATITKQNDKIQVHMNDEVIEHSPCKYPTMKPQHGAAWKAWAQYANEGTITYLSGKWGVPPNPTSNGPQTLFWWNGVEPDEATDVLQPVLQWGISAGGGGDYWALASWYVSSSGNNYVTPLISCNVGDTIYGVLSVNSTYWTIAGTDVNSNQTVAFNYATSESPSYTIAYEVLEAYNVDSTCSLYPPSGFVPFFNIQVQAAGNKVIPTWVPMTQDNECNEQAVVQSPTALQIKFNTK